MPKSTHRTIIFEEFDADKTENLYTLLDNNPSDDELYRGLQNLTVKSFNEFMEKFAPKVYEVYGKNLDTGEIEFFYTTNLKNYPNLPFTEMPIGNHVYFKMLARLYASKGSSGKSNLQFDDNEIIEMLTPKKELDEIRDTRQKIEYNLKQLHEAKARGDKATMNNHKKKILDCRKKIVEYATSPVNKLLPILIEDTNAKLELLERTTGGNSANGKKSLPAYTYGALYLNGEGKIDIDENYTPPQIAAPKEENTALVTVKNTLSTEVKEIPSKTESAVPDTQTIRNKIALMISNDYDEKAKNPNEMAKALIISAFSPMTSEQNAPAQTLDKNTLLERRKNFQITYANARKSFIREMSKIVESLLGVKTFFDHATLDGGDNAEIPGGVIIANCKVSRLLKIKNTFAEKMQRLGKGETNEQRIWFAVLPNVLESPPEDNSAIFEDDEDDDGTGGSLNENDAADSKKSADYVSINSLLEFLPIIDAAKIMTIFNIRTDGRNTFSTLNAAEVEDKIKLFNELDYTKNNFGHAVYAYPNFTLIRDRDFYPFEDDTSIKITLPGIYIDAAYPAAGLIVASQQQKILDNRRLAYDKNTPCVGIDFEKLNVKKAFMTKFNPESVLRRSENLIRIINKNMFGFSFSSDEVRDSGGTWKNSYIHCARTLAKNEKTGIYKPLYQTLVEDWVAILLKELASKTLEDISNEVAKINREWTDNNKKVKFKDYVNFLLRDSENIEVITNGDKLKIKVHFVGGDSYFDIDDVEGTTD